MKIGVFCPIGNNGWLLSENAPQYKPSFEMNKQIVQRAEHYGFDFALSMIKLRGFGGKTEFWDHNLETFTLMAGLAAVTSKIQIYATAATLVALLAAVAACSSALGWKMRGVAGRPRQASALKYRLQPLNPSAPSSAWGSNGGIQAT